ncbi:MAG: hypothetical protein COB66_00845 [Coxiella sp. (in: Bacteria)]|nr:MAG: hypothetical protein COB66_00845 [Coxiella sp. (in: g-proteobacteria)]
MKTCLSAVTAIAIATTAIMTPLSSIAQSTTLGDVNVAKLIQTTSAAGLQPSALKASLNAYAWARTHHKLGPNKNTLTVVDFTLPSYKKRLWVIDLKTDKVLMNLYTTQGKNSGLVYATHFSNKRGSDMTSLGLFSTAGEYYGHHAKSMHLDGLESGINSNARSRSVVIHSAVYATPAFINAHHRAGRSWGCFAVAPDVKAELLNNVKGGSALFAYAPQENQDPIVKNGPISLS